MVHNEVVLGGTQEWPWSLSSSRAAEENVDIFFSFLSYGVVRNTLNKY